MIFTTGDTERQRYFASPAFRNWLALGPEAFQLPRQFNLAPRLNDTRELLVEDVRAFSRQTPPSRATDAFWERQRREIGALETRITLLQQRLAPLARHLRELRSPDTEPTPEWRQRADEILRLESALEDPLRPTHHRENINAQLRRSQRAFREQEDRMERLRNRIADYQSQIRSAEYALQDLHNRSAIADRSPNLELRTLATQFVSEYLRNERARRTAPPPVVVATPAPSPGPTPDFLGRLPTHFGLPPVSPRISQPFAYFLLPPGVGAAIDVAPRVWNGVSDIFGEPSPRDAAPTLITPRSANMFQPASASLWVNREPQTILPAHPGLNEFSDIAVVSVHSLAEINSFFATLDPGVRAGYVAFDGISAPNSRDGLNWENIVDFGRWEDDPTGGGTYDRKPSFCALRHGPTVEFFGVPFSANGVSASVLDECRQDDWMNLMGSRASLVITGRSPGAMEPTGRIRTYSTAIPSIQTSISNLATRGRYPDETPHAISSWARGQRAEYTRIDSVPYVLWLGGRAPRTRSECARAALQPFREAREHCAGVPTLHHNSENDVNESFSISALEADTRVRSAFQEVRLDRESQPCFSALDRPDQTFSCHVTRSGVYPNTYRSFWERVGWVQQFHDRMCR